MKLSKFTFITDYSETDEILFYNTSNGSLLAFESTYRDEISKLLGQRFNIEINSELKKLLAEEDFLIEDGHDEISVIVERNKLGIKDANRLDVIIMPNMNCNFACVYCYETHEKSQMNAQTKDQLLAWLKNMIPKFKAVLISWFGGEPLLSYDTIIELQENILAICRESNTALNAHITTNGFLLDQQKIDKLLDLGIRSFQITLDGPPETHNAMRPLRGGGETFEKIYHNICLLARAGKKAHIKLRINYDSRNISQIKGMLDMFPVDVRANCMVVCETIFKETFGQIVETMGRGEEIEDVYKYAGAIGYMEDNEAMEANRLTFCYADRENQFLVNYNGDVFKCTVQKFDSKNRVGYLSGSGEITWEGNRLSNWHSVDSFEEKCFKCVFMPLCMGGCRKLRAVWGSVGEDCKAPFEGFDKKVKNFYERSLNVLT